jgi:hypothetical protein
MPELLPPAPVAPPLPMVLDALDEATEPVAAAVLPCAVEGPLVPLLVPLLVPDPVALVLLAVDPDFPVLVEPVGSAPPAPDTAFELNPNGSTQDARAVRAIA